MDMRMQFCLKISIMKNLGRDVVFQKRGVEL